MLDVEVVIGLIVVVDTVVGFNVVKIIVVFIKLVVDGFKIDVVEVLTNFVVVGRALRFCVNFKSQKINNFV